MNQQVLTPPHLPLPSNWLSFLKQRKISPCGLRKGMECALWNLYPAVPNYLTPPHPGQITCTLHQGGSACERGLCYLHSSHRVF